MLQHTSNKIMSMGVKQVQQIQPFSKAAEADFIQKRLSERCSPPQEVVFPLNLRQLCSSLPSEQSYLRLQRNSCLMHCPLAHWNSWAEHPLGGVGVAGAGVAEGAGILGHFRFNLNLLA